MDTKKLQLYFFIGLLLAVFVLTLNLFRPFIAPIALAFMTALLVRPVYKKFLSWFGNRRTLSSILSVLFVFIVILVPLVILIQQISVESYNFYTSIRDTGLGGFDKIFPELNPYIINGAKTLSDNMVMNASKIFSSTASVGLGLLIATIALFYMLRDGHIFKKVLVELSPLADKYDNEIIHRIESAVNSVVRGSLLASLIKGVFAAFGFYVFGVPHAILWGSLTVIVSLLPGIGAGLTIIPAILYLLALDSVAPAIGLGIWGTVIVGLIDNVLIPVFVSKGFAVHPLLILLSVLGGLAFFGPVGLFLGPLVIALLAALLEIYKLIILDDQHKKTTSV